MSPAGGDPPRPIRVVRPGDPRLAAYRELTDAELRARLEAEQGLFVVEGRVAVHQLLRSGIAVRSLLVDDHQVEAAHALVEGVLARQAPVYVGTRAVVAATVGFPLHRGVVALAARPSPLHPGELLAGALAARGGSAAALLVAEGLNDHENLGALFRNAAALGASGVLLDPSCADPLYRRSVRVSAGHVLSVPHARLAPWPGALATLRAAGVLLVALAPAALVGGRAPLPARALAELAGAAAGIALLVGAEGPGLSPAALAAADSVVRIPLAAGVDSLNVATAAAIALYELSREQRGAGSETP